VFETVASALGYRAIKNTGRVIAPTPVMKLLWKRQNQQTASLLIHYRSESILNRHLGISFYI